MELILWRHADAEYGYLDMDRPLSDKGCKQARKMAGFLLPKLPKDVRILVSPALRTQQTALALGLPFQTEPLLAPDASVEDILQAVDWPNGDGCTVVVGHQPTLGMLAARLLASSDVGVSIKKGAVWWMTARRHEAGTAASLRWAMSAQLL